MPDDRLAFNATLDGVRGLMPQRLIDATTRPSEAQVNGYIERLADRLIGRLGHPDVWPDLRTDGTAGLRVELVEHAVDIVELRAAARALDAGTPDRILTEGDRRQAEVWRREADEAEAELVAALAAAGYTVPGDVEAGAAGPKAIAGTFPSTPIFTRGMRF